MLISNVRSILQPANLFRFSACKMVSSFVNAKAEPDLYQHEVKIKTQTGKTVSINAVFLDTKPNGSDKGTVVAVHGAPGSHKDFKYVFPKLSDDIRFIGVNWPSMGYSSYDHDLVDDNDERVQLVQQIVDALKLDKIVFVGHSRGTENALKMGALNQDRTVAVILLNPIGLRPHKGVQPYWFIKYFSWLWKTFPIGHPILNPTLFWIYNQIGLRAYDGQNAGVCLNLMRYADFEGQKQYVDKLNSGDVRVLNCYAGKDFLVEEAISDELANVFVDNQKVVCAAREDSEVFNEVKKHLDNGTRHLSVFFEKDGHFLQKTRADFIAQSVHHLLNDNKSSQSVN